MPNFGVFPQTQVLVTAATITTNTTSSALTLPSANSYRIICSINTVSGTSPTMVMAVATSWDAGTTYQEVLTTSTMSTTGQGQQICFKAWLGAGDAATTQASSLLGVADLAAAVVNNGPINPQYVKIRFIVGGTSPSFGSAQVIVIAAAQDFAD